MTERQKLADASRRQSLQSSASFDDGAFISPRNSQNNLTVTDITSDTSLSPSSSITTNISPLVVSQDTLVDQSKEE